jgi:hypothetical protein
MEPTPRRRSGWLQPIGMLVGLLLLLDLLYLPLMLIPHGALDIGQVFISDLYTDQAYKLRRHLELSPGLVDVTVGRRNYLSFLLWSTYHGLAFTLATIPMLGSARRLVIEARRADPFTPDMVRRLRRLGFVVLIGGLLSEAAEYAANRILIDISVPHDDPTLDVSVSHYPTLWWLLPGFILLAISAIVGRGVDLRTELDGVI